jgi:hypothetical protein
MRLAMLHGTSRYAAQVVHMAQSTLKPSGFFLIIAGGLALLTPSVSAQLPNPNSKPPLGNVSDATKSVASAEADRVRDERKLQARSLLISLASEARSFRDQALRGRTLTRIADALWDVDAEQGRELFRRAWEAADTTDRESKEPLNLRRQVLAVVARRDRFLAEEFLQKMKADQDATKTENSKPSLWELPEAMQQRLSLAESLLRTGDTERALQFADPVLGSVTISTLDFLTQLREKDPTAADQRYAALLANTGGNMLADANTISLLSSYIFTPQTYVVFNNQGAADSSFMRSSLPPANVDPQLRLAFFQTAAAILLRPQPPAEQDQSTTGIAGKYMVVKRLIPIFDLYAPKEIAAAIHDKFEELSSLASVDLRKTENESLQKGISPEKSLADEEKPLLDQIEHAKTSDEGDDLYFKLALVALNKDDSKARDYVSKIEESGFRQRAQGWVDWGLAIRAIKKKATETALELARKGELTHVQRVWILTQSAKLLARTDRGKALSLLEDGMSEARRIEGSDLDRPRALLALANSLELIDPSRAWDAIFEAVKAANSTEGFTGDGGVITVTINSKSQILRKTEAIPDFDIKGIFAEAAIKNYDRVIQLAAGFQGEAARANATIAIARSVLNQKNVSAPAPQSATKN